MQKDDCLNAERPATNKGSLTISALGDREIVMSRVFDAPRELVFEAHTKPDLVKRWLGVFGGWTLPVCEIDLRAGGAYRYVWRNEAKGHQMACGGVFREVVPPERLVCTEQFDDPWYPGESLITTVFTEKGGKTTMTMTMRYATREARDGVLKSPMEHGVAEGYNKMDALLAEMAAQGR